MRASVCVFLAASACSSTVATPPPRADAQAVVVAFLDADGTPHDVAAADPRGDWAVRGAADPPRAVVVAYYDRPLAALDLTAGPVVGRDRPSCARLFPSAVWTSPGLGADFVSSERLPSALEEALVPSHAERCGRCATFVEARVDIPGQERRLEAGAPLSDGRVLIMANNGGLWAVSPDGVDPISGCPRRAWESLAPIADDHFLVGVFGGAVMELAISPRALSCTVVGERTTTTTRTVEWLTASPDGREIAGVDAAGRLLWGAPNAPLEVQLELPINERKFTRAEGVGRGAILWLGPGDLVANASATEIHFWSGGHVRRVESFDPQRAWDSVSDLALVAGEVYAGDGGGQVLRIPADGSPPELLPGGPSSEIVGTIAPDRDGFVTSHGDGTVAAYYPTVGWCPPHPIAGATDRGTYMFKDSRGAIVVPDVVGGDNNRAQVVWLRPVKDPG